MAKRAKAKAKRGATRRAAKRAAPGSSELLATGKRLGDAFRARDRATVRALTTANYTHIDAGGRVHDKAEVLRNLEALVGHGRESGTRLAIYGRLATIVGRRKARGAPDVVALHIFVKGRSGWRLLVSHDNPIAARSAPKPHHVPIARPPNARPPECRNPLDVVPYKARSAAERAAIKAFQTMERAVVNNDPVEWRKWVADEFIVYRTGQHPTTKAGRIATISAFRKVNAETFVAEISSMQLRRFGDAVVMRADHVMPGNRRPPYRATRIWVKRGGRWQMAISQQTTIAS